MHNDSDDDRQRRIDDLMKENNKKFRGKSGDQLRTKRTADAAADGRNIPRAAREGEAEGVCEEGPGGQYEEAAAREAGQEGIRRLLQLEEVAGGEGQEEEEAGQADQDC
jgi:hypothetical protein